MLELLPTSRLLHLFPQLGGLLKRMRVKFSRETRYEVVSTSAVFVPLPRFLGSADPHQPYNRVLLPFQRVLHSLSDLTRSALGEL